MRRSGKVRTSGGRTQSRNGECAIQQLETRRLLSAIAGRFLFYDNSYFDQNTPGPNAADDAAIAIDKKALLPGQTATFANYSSYSRGINGIFVDFAKLPNPSAVGLSDFEFAVGTSPDASTWTAAPAPVSITVRTGAGIGGSDRVSLIWADGAIAGKWLRVTVRATAATGLAVSDVFYFGNAVGEAGDSPTNALVTSADELLARINPRTPANPAPITDPYDYNRDGLVDAQDQLIARTNRTSPVNGLPLITAPQEAVLHLRPEALAAEAWLKSVSQNDSPQTIYDAFNAFSRTHFGAQADPLVYEKYGQTLNFVADGEWIHVSENSASIGFQTNLPAVTWIEYGTTTAYGQRTDPTDRFYSIHLQQLKGLQTGQTYHYRIVAVDERGQVLMSEDRTITPQVIPGAIYLYQKADGSPHQLTQGGKTYVLKEDLIVSGKAIDSLRDDITIDLNGHTIIFGQGAQAAADVWGIDIRGGYNGATEINGQGSRVRVVNGTIMQGESPVMQTNTDPYLLNAIRATGASHEIAGVNIIYHASQSWGIQMNHSIGNAWIHHNVIRDMGAVITDRHGAGTRAIGWRFPKEDLNNFKVDHNLIPRIRQNGISVAHDISYNEIYVDSWSTNSFAIQPLSIEGIDAGTNIGNRIFATGYNPYGFGWAHENLLVQDNLVHLFGINVHNRWPENWGDVNLLAGFRITNYSPGGQPRNNLVYRDNLILGFAKEGAQIEGTRFYSDVSIANVLFTNNVVKAESLDMETLDVAAIVTQGYFRKLDSLPIFYTDSKLISNRTIVQFGSAYGRGNNHHFERIEFIRTGDREDFATFRFDGTYWSVGHVVLDGIYGPGTAWNDVYWEETGTPSMYTVKWTLDLQVPAGAEVTILDANGNVEFSGIADSTGRLAIPLTHADIRPTEWYPGHTGDGPRVREMDKHQEILYTPHTVTVTLDGLSTTRTVEMTQRRELTINASDLQPMALATGMVAPATSFSSTQSGAYVALGRSWARGGAVTPRGPISSPFAQDRLIDPRLDDADDQDVSVFDVPQPLIQ